MKKTIVMRAIAHEMDNLHKIYTHPANAGKPRLVQRLQRDAQDLHEAYFELRGYTGITYFVAGVDVEEQRFVAIYNDIMRQKEA